jgi:Ceramidase
MNDLNCPWMDYPRGNFPLCEEALCEWIRQPANTYSNIGFFIVAFYLIYLSFKKQSEHGLGFGICAIFIGSASFGAHASGTKMFGFFDFAAIFSAFSLYAAKDMIYTNTVKTKNVFLMFCAFFIAAVLLLYQFSALREIIFAIFVIGLLIWESKILKAQGKSFLTTSNKKMLGIFLIGAVCLALDASKVICDPQNHLFQMHSVWHICCALSVYFLARHLDQHRPVKN